MSEPVLNGRRRSTRLTIAIPIFISGMNLQREYFREKTHTLVVNKHGAKIATAQEVAAGTEIVIENPAMKVTGKAKVVTLGDQPTPESVSAVAVELNEAQNIWGIQFPPEDWDKS